MDGSKMDTTYDIPAGVVARNLSGEMVILDLEKGIYFGLNAVGTMIWEMLGEGRSLADIKTRIVADYDVAESDAEADLLSLVSELRTRGLIVPA
jgi:hypothetical protein